ncbi:MAG TPA: RnfABCDGE type electron transport complex subunit A [Clostridiaceae bacterium]|nr:RnfABCDGE type electron transport complex subunit A [Clostridiaceae bacterium]
MNTNLFYILFVAILVENYVYVQFLGICPFLGVSKNLKTAMGMSVAVIFVMVLATAVTWPINHFILETYHLDYLQTLVFILIIAALVQLVETFMKRYMVPLYNALGIYLPLITTNCIVLGVVLLNVQSGYGFTESMVNSIGGGLGFLLAMFMFSGIRSRIDESDIPDFLSGLPITLIAAGIAALSFQGFVGIAENLFT